MAEWVKASMRTEGRSRDVGSNPPGSNFFSKLFLLNVVRALLAFLSDILL